MVFSLHSLITSKSIENWIPSFVNCVSNLLPILLLECVFLNDF